MALNSPQVQDFDAILSKMIQGTASQTTQAQTTDAVTQNIFSDPLHSQVISQFNALLNQEVHLP
jgi:hypothetical protein